MNVINELHLCKIPIRATALTALARRRGLSVRDLDEGYLVHTWLRQLWGDLAPATFRTRDAGRVIEVWGYAPQGRDALVEHARIYGDPEALGVIDELEAIAARPVPALQPGQRVGFELRACPVVRLARGNGHHRAGAEVDAFEARCFAVEPTVRVDREQVYSEWLEKRMVSERVGAVLESARVTAFARERFVRRAQASSAGEPRQARRLERPDVRFEGTLRIEQPVLFQTLVGRGVGRHKAFGFGMLMLVPPRPAASTAGEE